MTFTKNNNFNENRENRVKQKVTIFGLIFLTIGLMILFKNNSSNIGNLSEQALNYYSDNLKPLFYKTNITEEDVFNFAVYNNLPIDSSNGKVLQLSLKGNDGAIINYKSAIINNTNNYSKFLTAFNLNNTEKAKLDSILLSYKDKINNLILVDDNSSVAVDPNIVILREALVYDINNFLSKNNIIKGINIFEQNKIDNSARKVFTNVKENLNNNKVRDFIFFTPDTVVNITYSLDGNIKNRKDKHKIIIENYGPKSVVINENDKLVEVKVPILPKINKKLPNNKLIINNGNDSIFSNKLIKIFRFNYNDIESTVNTNVKGNIDNAKTWAQFGFKADSLGKNINIIIQNDSILDMEELNKELIELKKELKKLKQHKVKDNLDRE